ncbi:alanine aminotransferase 2-like isoform X2 [Stegodyphus dumicola]|uniref:alanine aminotransferase 2-like isoform X2 n=1 Tax=Stegodyphus dumicola TaxID=202533 RepID=UPI0015AD526E|nr:alanine aminotransferase 2-like isoform X2 [Stegodyphus dumicola]
MDFAGGYLTADTINQNLRHMEFPWPSPVVSRGNEIEREIKKGKKFTFEEVIHAHAGDPQGMGQKPVTFFQQVVSLCFNPSLLQSPSFPSDAKQRAMTILKHCRGCSTGSYTDCSGMLVVRQQVAEFIQNRDSVPASYEDIFLSNGATDAIRVVLSLFNNSATTKPPGVMIPIPQYPLFSSTVAEYGFVMSQNDMQNVIKFAYEENLLILADEVYQYNVYDSDLKFFAFKKVMKEMGLPFSNIQLASFMSGSKGYMGECGTRSGYCEIVNLDNDVKEILMKLLSVRLSPNLHGQIIMYCITNPPQRNEPSYELFEQEKTSILQSLKERAQYCYEKFNSVEGLSCNKVVGAMYVYPKIELSRKALKGAQVRNVLLMLGITKIHIN